MKTLSKASFEEVSQGFAPSSTRMILAMLQNSGLEWSSVYVQDDVFKQWFEATQDELAQQEMREIQQEYQFYKDVAWNFWICLSEYGFYAKVSDVFDIDTQTIDRVLTLYGDEFYSNIYGYDMCAIPMEDAIMIFGRYLKRYRERLANPAPSS